MAKYPTILEPTWAHVRQREPPLYQMPHMWQPNLNMPNPYLSSHVDRVQRGWQKWGHDYQDFYAQKADATSPDWYSRRTNTIRGGDIKELLWPYEGTSKPTEKKTFGITKDPPIQWRKGYRAVPHDIEGQVVVPRWGLYHPGHYECPGRAEQLPAIHPDEKHL